MNNTVLIIANDFTTIYNFRLELLERLKECGYSIVLALPSDKRNDSFQKYASVEIIPLQRFGTNPIQDFKTIKAIMGLIREYKPTFVFTYTAKPNIYGGLASRICKVPYACNVTGLGKNIQSKSVVGSIMIALQRIAYKGARVVFFQNEENYQFMKRHHVVDEQAALLPGSGVNLETNSFEPFPNNEVTTFVVISRIRQDKGYDELFNAIRLCAKYKIAAHFTIVGWYEDETYKTIVEEITKTGLVDFVGDVPHESIHGIVKECDCLIHPSHHEGMSNVILEASASGRPCIVSNIHGCIEGVEDGVSGFHFKVKDGYSLYEMIIRFVYLPRDAKVQMGMRARKLMEEKFDRTFVVDRYLSLLENE